MTRRATTSSGFTLLELLVVMVIIGMLAAFVAPRYFAQVGKSQAKSAKAQITALEQALEQYRLDVGTFPSTQEGLAALNAAPSAAATGWYGPYLKKAVPPDPWGRPYQYVNPGQHGEIDLFSLGRDGREGGSGDDGDVTNW
ncbi:MAG: type II secretion system major pseudopilin GspG [Steroidobacteraceae bacterium]